MASVTYTTCLEPRISIGPNTVYFKPYSIQKQHKCFQHKPEINFNQKMNFILQPVQQVQHPEVYVSPLKKTLLEPPTNSKKYNCKPMNF